MSRNAQGTIFALICVTLWGLTFIFSRVLLDAGATPYEILLSRFILAWACLSIVKPKGVPFEGFKKEIPYIGAGIFGVSLYFIFENTALMHTKVANVGVLADLAPIFTALAFWLVYGFKPQPRFFLGFVISLLGVVLVSTGGNFSQLSPSFLGDALAILAAITWTGYSISIREIRMGSFEPKTEDSVEIKEFDSLAVTKRIFFWGIISAFFMFPFMKVDFGWICQGGPIVWTNLGFLALGGSALNYVLWNLAIEKLGEVRSSLYLYLIPVVTVVASFLLLGEQLSLASIAGIVAVILGLIISSKGSF